MPTKAMPTKATPIKTMLAATEPKTISEVKESVRLAEWTENYKAYQESCMSVKEWCEMNGIAQSTFYHRLRRIRENLCEAYLPKEEHAVVPIRQGVSPTIKVESGEVSVSIIGNASAERIRAVIEAMKSC